jgi:hypothetical protein
MKLRCNVENFHAGSMRFFVREVVKDDDGLLKARDFIHQPILGSMCADGPAAAKVSKHLTAGAFLGCGVCGLRGVNDIPVKDGATGDVHTKKGVMHYLGYDKPTPCGLLVPGAPTTTNLCGDPAIRFDHDSQVLFATYLPPYVEVGTSHRFAAT